MYCFGQISDSFGFNPKADRQQLIDAMVCLKD